MQEIIENRNNHNGNGAELNSLVQRLQKEDTRNLLIFKRFQWIFLVFIVLYSFFFILNPFEDFGWSGRITGGCYVMGFIIFGLVFRKYYRRYKSIDYSVPVAEMLQKAAERYKLQYKKTWVLIFPLLLIDAGITISFFEQFTSYAPWERIALVQLAYIPTLVISFFIGMAFWYKRQKPLRDDALRLLDELLS